MTSHKKLICEILGKIEEKRAMYGSVVVKSLLYRMDSQIVNFSTLIMPLYSSDVQTKPQRFDYGKFIIQKEIISLDRLLEIIKDLPEKGITNIALGDLMVQFNVNYSGDYYKWDSGVSFLDIGWLFEKYQFNDSPTGFSNQPLVAIDLPLFPDYREAVDQFVGINSERYSSIHGIILCLPNYGARISQIDISSKTLRVRIEVKDEKLSNIVGKLYCRSDTKFVQKDITFQETTSDPINMGLKPDYISFVILSKATGMILDQRQFGFNWELPKGVRIEIPDYELHELIKNGETDTVELKASVGDACEFAETVVAFANQRGGVIIIGVDDKTNTIGLDSRNHKDFVTNIISSNCEPPAVYSFEERTLNEKKLLLVKVEEGKEKPYQLRERGVFIRANGTDRIATRFELLELTRSMSRSF